MDLRHKAIAIYQQNFDGISKYTQVFYRLNPSVSLFIFYLLFHFKDRSSVISTLTRVRDVTEDPKEHEKLSKKARKVWFRDMYFGVAIWHILNYTTRRKSSWVWKCRCCTWRFPDAINGHINDSPHPFCVLFTESEEIHLTNRHQWR